MVCLYYDYFLLYHIFFGSFYLFEIYYLFLLDRLEKMDLIAWVFRFLYLQLFKEVMDLVNNLNAVVGEYIHLFN